MRWSEVAREDRRVTVMVALLRGVNVGGRGTVAMADVRAAAEACGYTDVRSYIQSGNLVFSVPGRSSVTTVAGKLQRAIADTTSVQPEVIVRTRAELAAVVDANPFLVRGEDPAHLHVVLTQGPMGREGLASLDLAAYAPEEAEAVGTALYLLLPSGIGRSKLAADLARQKGPAGTTRNWRTITRLLAIAGELA